MKPSGRMRLLEVGGSLLIAIPFLTDFIERGSMPHSPRELTTEAVMGAVVLGFVWLLHRAHEEIRARDALRSSLMSTLVHDLKSPITAVVVAAKLVREAETPAERGRFIETILRACRKHLAMVDTLIDLDRLESASLAPDRRALRALELLDACREDNLPLATSMGAGLVVSCDGGLEVLADASLIGRVLGNLAGNALKHVRRGGSVALSAARTASGGVRFSVKDDGPGISREAQGKLFRRFARVDGDPSPGTGLGLYFCRLAVEAHGGRIAVASDLGAGAEFFFELPGGARRTPQTSEAPRPS